MDSEDKRSGIHCHLMWNTRKSTKSNGTSCGCRRGSDRRVNVINR